MSLFLWYCVACGGVKASQSGPCPKCGQLLMHVWVEIPEPLKAAVFTVADAAMARAAEKVKA